MAPTRRAMPMPRQTAARISAWTSPVRILYIIGQLSTGGAELQLIQLATHVDRARFTPIVCALSECVPHASELQAAGIQVITLPRKMDPDLTRLWRLPRLVRRCQPHLIHSYLFVANAWARLVGRFLGLPVVISERNTLIQKPRGQRIVDRALAGWASLMIANSQAGARLAIARHEIAPDKVVTIHNGIALERFARTRDRVEVRRELGLGPADPVVGIVARLSQQKDHATLMRAMAHVIEEMPSARLLCVGDGPLRSELQELAADLGLGHATIFAGTRSDVPDLLAAMDVVVLSSRWEGLPNTLMEAMAASRPVVATQVGGIPELVCDGETGLLVPPANLCALAGAILRLLGNAGAAHLMGLRGRMRVERDFRLDKMVAATEAAYETLLVAPGRVPGHEQHPEAGAT